ncbi:VanZ family protein [Candidatus Binatia bacterium]|jgi:VanZ family protein|nr:VanZ family protein [Candidatus Binatia bacterium]
MSAASLRGVLARWVPVAAWAAVISVLSSDSFSGAHTATLLEPIFAILLPGAAPETIHATHAVVRKLAHLTEYAVLGLLVFRALDRPGRSSRAVALQALVLCALYASLDELHQSFVPSRGAAPLDVVLDTTGAALGLALRLALSARVSAGRRSPA